MGVGTPADIVKAVGRGIDMFDCVHADAKRPQWPPVYRDTASSESAMRDIETIWGRFEEGL